jgi:hypothetical protein
MTWQFEYHEAKHAMYGHIKKGNRKMAIRYLRLTQFITRRTGQ